VRRGPMTSRKFGNHKQISRHRLFSSRTSAPHFKDVAQIKVVNLRSTNVLIKPGGDDTEYGNKTRSYWHPIAMRALPLWALFVALEEEYLVV
jgi:hypothetical protein